jgi:hypothetical protein
LFLVPKTFHFKQEKTTIPVSKKWSDLRSESKKKGESYRLESAQRENTDAQGDGILYREVLCGREAPGDEVLIFRHEKRMLIGGWIIRTEMCLACEHDDVAASAITVEVERDPRMLLQMLVAFGTSLAVHQDCRRCRIPEEPYGIGLRCIFAIDRREPENKIIA